MKKERLTGRSQFATVYQQGASRASRLLVVKALPNGLEITRCGFAVGKRVGGAVVRNRVKRLLREGLRQTPVEPGWDVILVARHSASTADYHQLKAAIQGLLGQAHLLRRA